MVLEPVSGRALRCLDYPGYVATCEEVAENGYTGFALTRSTEETAIDEEISA
jgi:hypothetical protein